MEFSEYRPIISGLLGGLVATVLCAAWARWLPRGMNGKSSEVLALQHRTGIWLANAAFFSGICLALYLYGWAGYASNDWRPIALGIGVAFSAPLVILPLVAWSRRCSPAEAYVAFALSQKMPVFLLYPLLALGIPLLGVAVAKTWL
jgi:hypothetical protein